MAGYNCSKAKAIAIRAISTDEDHLTARPDDTSMTADVTPLFTCFGYANLAFL